jgi:hypothetical protein
MKLLLVTLLVTLSGCALVQLSPTINCSYVKYERIQDTASVIAEECRV